MDFCAFGTAACSQIASALSIPQAGSGLVHLALHGNNLTDDGILNLRSGLTKHPALRTLNLFKTNFGDVGLQALGDVLEVNTVLQDLIISMNKFGRHIDNADPLKPKVDVDAFKGFVNSFKLNQTLLKLDMGCNDLGDECVLLLADALKSNKTLRSLILNQVKCTDVGALAVAATLDTNASLTELNFVLNPIGDTTVKAIAEALDVGVCQLAILYFGSCGVTDIGCCALANAIRAPAVGLTPHPPVQPAKASKMRKISLHDNKITSMGAIALAEACKGHPYMNTIDLYCNQIDSSGASAFAVTLQRNNVLTNINLESNKIGTQGMVDLIHALEMNSTVTILNCADNLVEETTLQFELTLCRLRNPTIMELDTAALERNDTQAARLGETLKNNMSLTKFYASDNQFSDAGVVAFARAVKVHPKLLLMDVRNNPMGCVGALAFGEALKINASLVELRLGGNPNIGDTGAIALAEALQYNKTLKRLDLDGTSMGPRGAQAFAVAFNSGAWCCDSVFMEYNDLGDEGCAVLFEALKDNRTLKEISMRHCKTGDQCLKDAGAMLGVNTGLLALHIGGGKASDVGANALAKWFKNNRTLTELDIGEHEITDIGAAGIASGLKDNKTMRILHLQGNKIRSAGVNRLTKMWAKHPAFVLIEINNEDVLARNDPSAKADSDDEKA